VAKDGKERAGTYASMKVAITRLLRYSSGAKPAAKESEQQEKEWAGRKTQLDPMELS